MTSSSLMQSGTRHERNVNYKETLAESSPHPFSGSMNQSPSHSQPLGGMKYSCFSFSLPVTSECLWRPTRPVVPYFPNILAWFSYWDAHDNMRGESTLCCDVYSSTYQLSKHIEVSLREGVELFLMCRKTQPHVESNLNRHLQALVFIHGVLRGRKHRP